MCNKGNMVSFFCYLKRIKQYFANMFYNSATSHIRGVVWSLMALSGEILFSSAGINPVALLAIRLIPHSEMDLVSFLSLTGSDDSFSNLSSLFDGV
ncbi:MAG: hypothetical protein JXR95_01015 [Deltaproteobacteria bacterium]|nr:hypothetical protein [Deltaproteobacteria bacterium]